MQFIGSLNLKNLRIIWYRLFGGEASVMVTLAAIVGVGAGLGAVLFRWLIDLFHHLFFGKGGEILGFLGPYHVVFLPAAGGLLVGLLVYFFAREAKGHGVPEVMESVALRGGRIRPIVVLIKSLASSICIGSGGSAGREGPIVQIGAGLGSTLGQVMNLSDRRTRSLLASGAAAGIAATFNTPIAGVLFALEVILGEFATETFSTVVIASVVATVIAQAIMGSTPAFIVPEYSLVSPLEIPLYVLLGGLCAVAGTVFIRSLHSSERFFERTPIPEYVRPALGGLLVGVIGVWLPQVFGVGYLSMDHALVGELTMLTLGVLVIAKIAATSLTLGSGGSGGVFAPSLFMGAMLGGLFGTVVHGWFPDVTAPSGAYALVGMGGLFCATARAPITAVIILFELTHDYNIILPLMFTCAVSTLLARYLEADSIYTIKLKARGVDLLRRRDFAAVQSITVAEAMKPVARLTTISSEMTVQSLARVFKETFHHGFAVLDTARDFLGVVTLKDLERAMRTLQADGALVRDICTTKVVTAYPEDSLQDVLQRFGALDIGRIPVVAKQNPRKLLGMLRWSDIVRSHSQVMLNLEYEPGTTLVKCDISSGDRAEGKSLRELALPADCVVNSIQRGKHLVVPRGDTVVQAGDKLIILASDGKEESVCSYLYDGNGGGPRGDGPEESGS